MADATSNNALAAIQAQAGAAANAATATRQNVAVRLESYINSAPASLPTLPAGISGAETAAYNDIKQTALQQQQDVLNQQQNYNAATNASKNALDAVATAQANEITATQQRAQTIADQNADVNSMYGIGTDANSRMVQLNNYAMDQYDQSIRDSNAAQLAAGATITSDPLLWFTKSLVVPELQNDADASSQRWLATKNEIDRSNTEAANQQTLLAQNVPAITVGMASAQANQAYAKASLDKSTIDAQAALHNVELGAKASAARIQAATSTINMEDTKRQQLNASIESQARAIQFAGSQEEAKIRMSEMLASIQDKVAQDKVQDAWSFRGLQLLGYNPTSMQQVKTVMPRFSAQQREAITMAGASEGLGTDPANALFTLMKFNGGGQNMASQTAYTRDMLGAVINKDTNLKQMFQQGLGDPKAAAKIAPDLANGINAKLISLYSNAADQQSTQVLNPKQLLTYLNTTPQSATQFKGVDSNTMGIIKSLAAQASTITDTTAAQSIVGGLIKKGYNPNQVGQQLSSYYRGSVGVRNSLQDFQTFGINRNAQLNAATSSYNINLPTGVFGSEKFDLTKPADATRYALRIRAAEVTADTRDQVPTNSVAGMVR